MTYTLQLAIVAVIVVVLAVIVWFGRNPPCPTCGRRKWDRKLCYPLLMCRHCAQRIDRARRKHN